MLTAAQLQEAQASLARILTKHVSLTEKERILEAAFETRHDLYKDMKLHDIREKFKEYGALFYINTREAPIIAQGSRQMVLSVTPDVVAKFFPWKFADDKSLSYDLPKELFTSVIKISTKGSPYSSIIETENNLRELLTSTNVPVAYHYPCALKWKEGGEEVYVEPNCFTERYIDDNPYAREDEYRPPLPIVCFSQDLREQGKWQVTDYELESTTELNNGRELNDQAQAVLETLKPHWVKQEQIFFRFWDKVKKTLPSEPYFWNEPHGEDDSAETAVRKMLLLQKATDGSNIGRLVIGDIDHIMLNYDHKK